MTQNENLTENISTPRTRKSNELSGLNSHYYQNMIVMSNNIETNRPQEQVLILQDTPDSSVKEKKWI
jgi:hypothetical protein